MTARKTGVLATLFATLAVVAAVTAATAPAAQSEPINIGRAGAGGCQRPGPADQRTRWGQRAQAPDHHVRHAEQQPGEGEGVRSGPDRQGRRHHVRHL